MPQNDSRLHGTNASGDRDAIEYLKKSVAEGKIWYIALLEAIALWTSPEENVNGYQYQYLVEGEAFDWLLLAERLCKEISDSIPDNELIDLLFHGNLPQPITEEEFKDIIGDAKYHAYLNYLYGITVETFIIYAMEDEILKERSAHALSNSKEEPLNSYQRLYGCGQEILLRLFREEKHYSHNPDISLNELREFTYWLFKYRLKHSDRAKLASDTKKGIDYFRQQRAKTGMSLCKNSQPQLLIVENGL